VEGSHVPHGSPNRARATYMPNAAQAVNGNPGLITEARATTVDQLDNVKTRAVILSAFRSG